MPRKWPVEEILVAKEFAKNRITIDARKTAVTLASKKFMLRWWWWREDFFFFKESDYHQTCADNQKDSAENDQDCNVLNVVCRVSGDSTDYEGCA